MQNLINFQQYLQDRLSTYFPSVHGAVLLIVVPSCLIVTVYFLSILREIVIDQYHQDAIDYENRLAPLKQDLPAYAVVDWVSDQNTDDDFVKARYVLIPARLVEGLKPRHEYLVVQYLDKIEIPQFEGYVLKKDYRNGVMLFKKSR